MKQLTYIKKGKLEWWDVPDPILQTPEDVIVRPLVVSRCDGDCAFLLFPLSRALKIGCLLHKTDPLSKGLFEGPFPVGHECVGEVVSCGDDVKRFSIGQKVIIPWAVSCGRCSHCRAGLTSKCTLNRKTLLSGYGFGEATGGWGGMVSDLVRVPHADHMLVLVPPGIDPSLLAPAADNMTDGWRTVAPQLKKYPQAPVLVMGGGAKSIGLYAAGLAVALGSSQVDYVDTSNTRLDIAKSLGANPIKLSRNATWFKQGHPPREGGYPITVDASNYEAGLRFAIRSLAPGGICTSVGFYFQKGTPLPLWQMYLNDSTFHIGVSHPRADLPDLLALLQKGLFDPEKITTLTADWEDAAEAFLSHSTKVVVKR